MRVFRMPIRVYYEDTDAGGIVYHANYLKFMERARCEWLQELGFDIAELQHASNTLFVVKEANLNYNAPARLFDQLQVQTEVVSVGKVKLQLAQNVLNKDELLCQGLIKLAALDARTFKMAAMPQDLIKACRDCL